MSRFYEIKVIGSILIVERKVSPKIRFFIRTDRIIPEILMISELEECSPDDIARSIRKLNYFLNRYTPEKH